jgi:hypothetical protein
LKWGSKSWSATTCTSLAVNESLVYSLVCL